MTTNTPTPLNRQELREAVDAAIQKTIQEDDRGGESLYHKIRNAVIAAYEEHTQNTLKTPIALSISEDAIEKAVIAYGDDPWDWSALRRMEAAIKAYEEFNNDNK